MLQLKNKKIGMALPENQQVCLISEQQELNNNNRQMIKHETYRNIFRDNSTKSLSKAKLESTNRFNLGAKLKEDGNTYSITTNAANYFSLKEDSKKEQKYVKRIKLLEAELKKKLSDDIILRNLFKTKTPLELSHLDLFLYFRKLEESLKEDSQQSNQLKKRVFQLEKALQKQQELHIQHMEIFGREIEQKEEQWKAQMQQLEKKNQRYMEQCENYKLLLEEIKKKHEQTSCKYKNICDEMQIQKSANILEGLREKQQYQAQINQLISALQQEKMDNQHLRVMLQQKCQESKKYVEQIQQIKDQKEKFQLRIKQIQEISKDTNIKYIQQKEIYHRRCKQLKLESQSKILVITNSHHIELEQIKKREIQMTGQIDKLTREIKVLECKLQEELRVREALQGDKQSLLEKLKNMEKQTADFEKKVVMLSIELMQVRFEKDEQTKRFQKQRAQIEEKQNIVKNSQRKRVTQSKNGIEFKSEVHRKYFRS